VLFSVVNNPYNNQFFRVGHDNPGIALIIVFFSLGSYFMVRYLFCVIFATESGPPTEWEREQASQLLRQYKEEARERRKKKESESSFTQ